MPAESTSPVFNAEFERRLRGARMLAKPGAAKQRSKAKWETRKAAKQTKK